MKIFASILLVGGLTLSANAMAEGRISWSQLSEPPGSYDALVEWQAVKQLNKYVEYRSSVRPGTSDEAKQRVREKQSLDNLPRLVAEPRGTTDAARQAIRLAQRSKDVDGKGRLVVSVTTR